MPFPTPTIRIRLTGLLAFFFTKDVAGNIIRCRIGIHDDALRGEHKPRIKVHRATQKHPGRDNRNLILEFFSRLEGANIDLTVFDPDPIAPGIILCPQTTGPFSTLSGNEMDFNLIPDIEGPDLHDLPLPNTFTNFITFNNGVFHTMATKPGWIQREKGEIAIFKKEVGIEAGINIYLQDPAVAPGSKAVLTVPAHPDMPGSGTFEFKKEPNVIHEIQMLNDCPLGGSAPTGIFESDFRRYYDKMSLPTGPVPQADRFSITFFNSGAPGVLSTDHPCGPVFGGKSS